MSKAEEFIKRQSHIIENPTSVWISSYNARKAVEIAKEEVIEKTIDFLNDVDTRNYEGFDSDSRTYYMDNDKLIGDFKKALEEDSI